MPADLNHLSNEEIDLLIERYYNGEKTTDLISEFKINAKPSQLVKLFPPRISDILCKYCGLTMIQYYSSRSYGNGITSPECQNCGHEEDKFCRCKNCQNAIFIKQQQERLAKQVFIKDYLSRIAIEPIYISELDLEQKIYLGAFLRAGISENFDFVKPIEQFIEPLAPTEKLSSEILKILFNRERRIISVSPSSDVEAFTNIENPEEGITFLTNKVQWQINITSETLNKIPLIESIINPESFELDSYWSYLFWKKIALHECLEFFNYSIESIFRSEYSIGEKTIATLKNY